MDNRIKSLDGWRAIACLGVVWIHIWTIWGNPALSVVGVNLFKLLAIVGNGVDFFFVISGFCLYLVLYNKEINWGNYFRFIKKRWIRIAPAFYATAIIISIYSFFFFKDSGDFYKLIPNFLFIQNLHKDFSISSPFWSLAVEFHFYLFLPLFFLLAKRITIRQTLLMFILLGLAFNLYFITADQRYEIVTKVIHFTTGIGVAWIYKSRPGFHATAGKVYWFLISLGVAFLGRYFMSDQYYSATGLKMHLSRMLGPTFLVVGFGGMMLNTIVSNTIGQYLGKPVMSFLGKISYSVYLWHGFLLLLIGETGKKYIHLGALSPLAFFAAFMLLLLPVSYLSYLAFEKFYFQKK